MYTKVKNKTKQWNLSHVIGTVKYKFEDKSMTIELALRGIIHIS